MIADNTLRSPHHPFGTYVPQGLSPSAAGHCLLLAVLLLLAVACGRPASYEKFVRADEAAGGVYEFCPEMSDTTASYDLSFYTAPLSEPLHLEIIWMTLLKNLPFHTLHESFYLHSQVLLNRLEMIIELKNYVLFLNDL